jgi:hypothetical protein
MATRNHPKRIPGSCALVRVLLCMRPRISTAASARHTDHHAICERASALLSGHVRCDSSGLVGVWVFAVPGCCPDAHQRHHTCLISALLTPVHVCCVWTSLQ